MIFDNQPQIFKRTVLLFLSIKAVLLLLSYYHHHIFWHLCPVPFGLRVLRLIALKIQSYVCLNHFKYLKKAANTQLTCLGLQTWKEKLYRMACRSTNPGFGRLVSGRSYGNKVLCRKNTLPLVPSGQNLELLANTPWKTATLIKC